MSKDAILTSNYRYSGSGQMGIIKSLSKIEDSQIRNALKDLGEIHLSVSGIVQASMLVNEIQWKSQKLGCLYISNIEMSAKKSDDAKVDALRKFYNSYMLNYTTLPNGKVVEDFDTQSCLCIFSSHNDFPIIANTKIGMQAIPSNKLLCNELESKANVTINLVISYDPEQPYNIFKIVDITADQYNDILILNYPSTNEAKKHIEAIEESQDKLFDIELQNRKSLITMGGWWNSTGVKVKLPDFFNLTNKEYNQVYNLWNILAQEDNDDVDELNRNYYQFENIADSLRCNDFLGFIKDYFDIPQNLTSMINKLYMVNAVSVLETLVNRSVERVQNGRCKNCPKKELRDANKCSCYFPTKTNGRVSQFKDFISIMKSKNLLNMDDNTWYDSILNCYELRNNIHLTKGGEVHISNRSHKESDEARAGYFSHFHSFSDKQIRNLQSAIKDLALALEKYIIPGETNCLEEMVKEREKVSNKAETEDQI
ncbi:MAG: hypothetical protein IKL53_08690 [Lachnospiraceae bacterium]|nr:hypothetical protein [Lachnospiraceae bacterium]